MNIKYDNKLLHDYIKNKDWNGAINAYKRMTSRNVISYSMAMNAYNNMGKYNESLKIYLNELNGIRNNICYTMALISCMHLKDIKNGEKIHNAILKNKIYDAKLLNTLINFYGGCGRVGDAENVFDSIGNKDIVSYNVMMKVYNNNGLYRKTLELFNDKYVERYRNSVSLNVGLNACGGLKDRENGNRICDEIVLKGYDNIELRNTMIKYYGIINDVDKAEIIFDGIKNKDIVSYNCLMGCYNENDMYHRTIELYNDNKVQVLKNKMTYIIVLNACTNNEDYITGDRICGEIVNMYEHTVTDLCNVMIYYYGMKKDMDKAQNIFDKMDHKNMVTYGSIMKAYNANNMYDSTIQLFNHNKSNGLNNEITSGIALIACIQKKDIQMGNQVCEYIFSRKHSGVETMTNMMQFYGITGNISKVEHIFQTIKDKSIIVFNVLMMCYNKNDMYAKTIDIYRKIKCEKTPVTCNLIIQACAYMKDIHLGQQIVKEISKHNYSDIELQNSLIHYYGVINDIQSAKKTYQNMNNPDAISIVSIMNAYKSNKLYNDALTIFDELNNKEFNYDNPNIYSIALYCCGETTNVFKGEQIIDILQRKYTHIYENVYIQCALIYFYGKCYTIKQGYNIFENNIKDNNNIDELLLLYGSMMDIYSKANQKDKVIHLFNQLKQQNITPNTNIYSIAINSCSHSGLTSKAMNIFNECININNGNVNTYALTSIIDCYSRSKDLNRIAYLYNKYSHTITNYKDKINILTSILPALNKISAQDLVKIMEKIYMENNDNQINRSIYLLLERNQK